MIARAGYAEPDELRLADVVAAAVRQSPELERARIDVDAARGALLQAEGVEDVHLGAVATATLAGDVRTGVEEASDAENVGISVSRALSTGGILRLSATGDRTHRREVVLGKDADGKDILVAKKLSRYAALPTVQLVQPLLRGAGATAFEAPIRQAARQRDAAALNREARARTLVVSLAQAYWQVAFAWRQLDVRKVSLELAEKQLVQTENAIRTEKVSRSEALAVQEAIAIRKQDVIAAEQDLYERSVALRQLGGLEIGPDAITVKTERLPEKVEAAALDVAAVVREAFEHSAELAALEATRRAAEAGRDAADGAARSRLDLDVSAGPVGNGEEASDALSDLFESPSYQITASLTFDRAIQRRTERGGQAVARAAVSTAKVAEREARARLAVRATRAAQRANAALAGIALGDQAIGLADQNVAAEQTRFLLGKSNNFEVLRRQDELEQARLRHAAAVADYLAARADLDGLSGAILARYRIVMP